MPKIQVLPDIVANKIAAGEVVERPASVVKELVENSLDAGADEVTVEIEKGGKSRIRISDNGEGMSHDDALLSIERHATSKIKSAEDIENIITLGFRGEAIPSIVSVSRTSIETRRESDDWGTRVDVEGGVVRKVTRIGRDPGTDIEVRNLFYNMPARRKFLRSDNLERTHIKNIMYDFAVSSPGLNLKLISSGREIFSFIGTQEPEEMLRQIYGETITELMVPVSFNVGDIKVEGFVGKPETARTSGFNQAVIVNGRPVKSYRISRAVFDGYGHTIEKGTYPVFVMYIEAEPNRVDVNIHPAKREIKIHRDFALLSAIRDEIGRALNTMDAAPNFHAGYRNSNGGAKSEAEVVYTPPPFPGAKEGTEGTAGTLAFPGAESLARQSSFTFDDSSVQAGETRDSGGNDSESGIREQPPFWQLKDRYIITSIKEGGIIVDQHAAHERILYEDYREKMHGREAESQQLLFPLTLDFTASDWDVLEPMLTFLNRIGFSIRDFGNRSVLIDAVPAGFPEITDDGRIIYEFIDEMRTHGKVSSGYIDKLAAAMACRAAIKAGAPLTVDDMRSIVDRLFATEDPFHCPHGRPTIIRLTIEDLDKRFGR